MYSNIIKLKLPYGFAIIILYTLFKLLEVFSLSTSVCACYVYIYMLE